MVYSTTLERWHAARHREFESLRLRRSKFAIIILMSYFENYTKYIQDNPEGYWFKRKLYGWGWTPVKWQGWLTLAIYLLTVFGLSHTIYENSSNKEVVFTFLLPLVLLTITLIRICYKKGEKPRWQWGIPKDPK